jgi:hypothetical protein
MIVTKGLGGGSGLLLTKGYGWFSAGELIEVIHGSIVRIRHFTSMVPDRVYKVVNQRSFLTVVANRMRKMVAERFFKGEVNDRQDN